MTFQTHAIASLLLVSSLSLACASRGSTGKRYNDIPLQKAAVKNDAATVRSELAKGYKVNSTSWGDRTALLYACYSGSTDAAIVLLAAGADPTIPDNKGHTPLMWAVRSGKVPLVQAVANTRKAINAQNQTGTTAMHYAAQARREDLIKILIAAGGDPNVRDGKGRRPVELSKNDPLVEAALGGPAVK